MKKLLMMILPVLFFVSYSQNVFADRKDPESQLILQQVPLMLQQFQSAKSDFRPLDVHIIHNCIELQNIQNAGDYVLANDIDCTDTLHWNNGHGFIPISKSATNRMSMFQGTLDGQGYTIINLFMQASHERTSSAAVGLFQRIMNAQISNLHLKNILYRLDYDQTGLSVPLIAVGGLSGSVGPQTTITNVTVDGQIYVTGTQNAWIGGIAGSAIISLPNQALKISNVSFKGVIEGPLQGSVVGGIAGVFWGGIIDQARVEASLKGAPAVGGVVASISLGNISRSVSHGTIVGGRTVGGILGLTTTGQNSEIISDCYSTMNVLSVAPNDDYRLAGGLIGYAREILTLQNSYATGMVFAMPNKTDLHTGGLIGDVSVNPGPTISSSYWNTETTLQTKSAGSLDYYGKTTAQLQLKFTFFNWDFNTIPTWEISEGQDSPHLQWEKIVSTIDGAPPVISNGMPGGDLPVGTLMATLSVTTNEAATCHYATEPNIPYSSMPGVFLTTNKLVHTSLLKPLKNGSSYRFNVRCMDNAGNADMSDYVVNFTVGKVKELTKYED